MPLGMHRDSMVRLCDQQDSDRNEKLSKLKGVMGTNSLVNIFSPRRGGSRDGIASGASTDNEDDDEEEDDEFDSSKIPVLNQNNNSSNTLATQMTEATDSYQSDPYAPTSSSSSKPCNLLCCLAPWKQSTPPLTPEEEAELAARKLRHEQLLQSQLDMLRKPSTVVRKQMLDEVTSTVREQMQNSERTSSNISESSCGSANPTKGILLKRGSFWTTPKPAKGDNAPTPTNDDKTNNSNNKDDTQQKRRSLFPTTSYKSTSKVTTSNTSTKTLRLPKRVRFSSRAKLAMVPSRHSMPEDERFNVWWTRADFDDFKKAGRIITRALLEGGSEIWLTQDGPAAVGAADLDADNDLEIQDKTHAPLTSSATTSAANTSSSSSSSNSNDYGSKWWCKFGHSRRGLEHIAHVEEGRLRQRSVANAIQAVLKEQEKQLLSTGKVDPLRLARVSLQFTKWAKDLALAAGRQDAQAVKFRFKECDLLERERAEIAQTSAYLKTLTRRMEEGEVEGRNVNVLDANTRSSLLAKQKQEQQEKEKAMANETSKVSSSLGSMSSSSSASTNKKGTEGSASALPEAASCGSPKMTAKGNNQEGRLSLAKQAAGFGMGKDGVDLQHYLDSYDRRSDKSLS